MSILAFVTDQLARKFLAYLGLGTPLEEMPPPIRSILRVAEHEGWGVPADWD